MTSGLAGKRVGASVGHRDIKHAFDLSSSNTSLSGTSSLAWNETGSGVTSSGNARSTPLLAAARDADEAGKGVSVVQAVHCSGKAEDTLCNTDLKLVYARIRGLNREF